MKWQRHLYWVATVPLVAMMLFATFNYFFSHELIVIVFARLGYPAYIVYPLAIAKLLGVVAILSNVSPTLKEWAYAGFAFNFILALSAHINAGDGEFAPALVCLVLLSISYVMHRKLADE